MSSSRSTWTSNPNITIVHNKAASRATPARTTSQKLGKEGLADIEAVEVDWFAEAMQYSDLLAEVPDSVKGRWLDWKEAAATDPDGRLVGFGTDIGPRGHLLPRRPVRGRRPAERPRRGRRAARRRLEQLLRRRRPYKAATGKPIDRLGALGVPGHGQPDRGTPTRSPTVTSSRPRTPRSRTLYNQVSSSATQSAYAGQWSDDWFASLANGEFATMLCPGWMLGVICGQRPECHRVGHRQRVPQRRRQLGRFVPDRSGQRRERRGGARAGRLADRSRAQVKTFTNAGTFPSQSRRK